MKNYKKLENQFNNNYNNWVNKIKQLLDKIISIEFRYRTLKELLIDQDNKQLIFNNNDS